MHLTLVIPKEQLSREEELNLLINPEPFRTVLVINGPSSAALSGSPEPLEFLTPLTQFIRGIYGAINQQRVNAGSIFQELKNRLRSAEVDDLFDDESFSKSKLYHWIIKTCHELCGSMDLTSKFIPRFDSGNLAVLQEKAHAYEKVGLKH